MNKTELRARKRELKGRQKEVVKKARLCKDFEQQYMYTQKILEYQEDIDFIDYLIGN